MGFFSPGDLDLSHWRIMFAFQCGCPPPPVPHPPSPTPHPAFPCTQPAVVLSGPTLALPEHRTPRVSHPCPQLAVVRQWGEQYQWAARLEGGASRARGVEAPAAVCCGHWFLGRRASGCSSGPGAGWRAPPGRLRLREHPPPGSCQCPRHREQQPCSEPAAHPAGRSLRAGSSPAAEGRGSAFAGPRPRSTGDGDPAPAVTCSRKGWAGWQRNRKETRVQQTLGHLFPRVSCVWIA